MQKDKTKNLMWFFKQLRKPKKLFQAEVDAELLDCFLEKKSKEKPKLTNQQFIETFISCYLTNSK